MPTGYTAQLMEKGQTFEEFVMLCARAMGACVMMRDDDMSTPIPQKFEPSPWYQERLEAEKTVLRGLLLMTPEEQMAFGERKKVEAIESHSKWLERERAQNKRLVEMHHKVSDWQPPTEDHQGLKRFMLEQLTTSLNDTRYIEMALVTAQNQEPAEYYRLAVEASRRMVAQYEKHGQEEIDRVKCRNDWLEKLRESLKNGK